MSLRYARAVLELTRGRYADALASFATAETLAEALVTPHAPVMWRRSWLLQTLVRLGQTEWPEQALAELSEDERASAEMRTVAAALRLAAGDPAAAAAALAPVLDGSAAGSGQAGMTTALLLAAQARDALGDQASAGPAREGALDITESDGRLLAALPESAAVHLPFLLDTAPALLERHRQYRTAHRALLAQILSVLSSGSRQCSPGETVPPNITEQLTDSETRVLRYLPTHLTMHDIANELFLSVNTVNTHQRHVYSKLGVHSRHDAVDRARALGLLAPSARSA